MTTFLMLAGNMPRRSPAVSRILALSRLTTFESPPEHSILPAYATYGETGFVFTPVRIALPSHELKNPRAWPGFPLEIVDMICLGATFETLKALACVSQVWWAAACPLLWKDVRELALLLHMMIGTTLASGTGDISGTSITSEVGLVCTYIFVVYSVLTFNKMGATVDHDCHSFERIASFVKSLAVYRDAWQNPLYLSGDLVKNLVARAEGAPLLPNLQSLSLGMMDWEDPEHHELDQWMSDAYHANLLALFLSPSVKRLALSCDWGALDIGKLHVQAPSLAEFCLWVRDADVTPGSPIVGPHDSTAWSEQAMLDLMRFQNLSTLHINSLFLTPANAPSLGRLPALQRLVILCDDQRRWERVQFDPDCFPCLRSLSLIGVPGDDASIMLGQPDLMAGLRNLCVTMGLTRNLESQRGLIALVCRGAPALAEFECSKGICDDFDLLTVLPLSILKLNHFRFTEDITTSITNLHPGLQSLTVDTVWVPATILESLASCYPRLRHLEIGLVTYDTFASLEAALPQVHVAASFSLAVSVRDAAHGNQYPNGVAMLRLLEYVISIMT